AAQRRPGRDALPDEDRDLFRDRGQPGRDRGQPGHGCTTKFAWPIADHGLGRRLHRVQVPTLIVWGREDALVPVGYAKEFGSRIAGSRVEVLDDCGHVVQVDQPGRSWTAISGFLAD